MIQYSPSNYCIHTFNILYYRKRRQLSKNSVEDNKMIPPPVSYTRNEDTGYDTYYDEVIGIQSHW